MSYILDALRRAERERHLGQAPTAQTLAQAGSPVSAARSHRWVRWGVAAVMVALVVASAWMLWPRSAPPASEPVAAAPAPQPVATAPAVPAPVPAAVEAAAAAEVIDDSVAVESLDDVAPTFGTASAPAGSAPPPAAISPSIGSVTIEQDGPAMPESPPAEPSSPAAAAPSAPPTASTEPALPRTLREMPPSYRANFPPIALDVHVYDADPARRWVMIGGRRYNEGDTLATGPRVAAILPQGLVVEHAGERVLVPLNR
jgi:general secretion pathway protein B